MKEGRVWQIPNDAEKPTDGRVSSGKYKTQSVDRDLKPLPIGISDYVRAQSEYYYVDKTLLIKGFLDRKPLVPLFTRPRRFGKALNMDMLSFFSKYPMKILADILRIKISRNAAKNIVRTRKNIR